MIPYGRQEITTEDIDSVVEVLKSNFITQGPKVPEFENLIKSYCGVKYAVAVNSSTSALHIACLALDLGPGDWLWTTPITFVASANCARYCGAQVDFVDIDPLTANMSPDALREKLVIAKIYNKLPKIVIPVHLAGQSCDMRAIYGLSQEFGFQIIEDASHAIGGRYENEPIGICQYSAITVFSFHPVKIITTGEGGMAVTNSAKLASKMQLLRSHGITRDKDLMSSQMEKPSWYYEQQILGFNYRLTDIQAALGISQLNRLDKYISKRAEIAGVYSKAFSELPVGLPFTHKNYYSAWHLYVIRINGEQNRRNQIFESLKASNIHTNLHYIPVHLQPYYKQLGESVGYNQDSFPESLRYYQEAITLPIYPKLLNSEQELIINIVKNELDRG